MAGDELDDGLDYDVDFSADEGVAVKEETSPKENIPNKKRLIDHQDQDDVKEENSGSKKKKKNPKLDEKKKIRMDQDMQKKRNLSMETPDMICDYANDVIRRKNNDLSALELSELYFSKSDFRTTADFTEPRNLDNLPKFIKGRFENMILTKPQGKKKSKKDKKNKKESKPPTDEQERKYIAVMAMSAIRACDIHRAIRGDLPGTSLKLLPKNKLENDLEHIRTSPSRIISCTPGRMFKAVNSPDTPLKKEDIKIVILDNSYLDKKQQNLWDIEQTTEAIKDLTKAGAKVYLY